MRFVLLICTIYICDHIAPEIIMAPDVMRSTVYIAIGLLTMDIVELFK